MATSATPIVFERSKDSLRAGTRVVLFVPPGEKTVRSRGNGNPYVDTSADVTNPDTWKVVRGVILDERFDSDAWTYLPNDLRRSVEDFHSIKFDPSSTCIWNRIQWENGASNKYVGLLREPEVWTVEEYEHYCDLVRQKLAVGSEFKPEEFERVVMSDDNRKSIIAVLKQHQNSKKIFEEWGLGAVIEYGKGMTMLFWGPPGTGKTWAATCMARAMGRTLKVIDTAQLQSSEPGGMERNLKAAFAEATRKREVLLIDECDSMIQQRDGMGMILSAEINCLLTELDKYEGIVVLSTNRIAELDKALQRRISLIVEFPKPTAEQRVLIWKGLLPEKLPLAKDVNVEKLAEAFDVTGGYIKNCVLNAARFAVSDDKEEVGMEHFLRAMEHIEKGNRAFSKKGTVLHGRQQVIRTGAGVSKQTGVDLEVDVDEDKGIDVVESPTANSPEVAATV